MRTSLLNGPPLGDTPPAVMTLSELIAPIKQNYGDTCQLSGDTAPSN